MPNIIEQLDQLIKTAKTAKVDALKTQTKTAGISADLDHLDDHTKPATTGAHAAANNSASREMYSAPSVDVGAETNSVGGSVEESTEGATATAVNGQSGGQGAELDVTKDADNGEELSQNKIAAARKFAGELRKVAEAQLTPLDKWLVKSAKDSSHPLIKAAMEAMDDGQMADGAADVLLQAIESGELSEEEAASILQDAVAEGAISEEDLAAAGSEMGAGDPMADEAALGDAAAMGGDPSMMDPAMMGAEGAAPMDPSMVAEAGMMDPKIAADRSSPKYLEKLASDYSDYVAAGYGMGVKIAEAYLSKKAEDADPKVTGEESSEGSASKEKSKAPAEEEVAAVEGECAPVVGGEEAAVAELPPGAGAEALTSMMGIPEPASQEEQDALRVVEQELGLSPEDTAALMGAPIPPMDKVASYKARCRSAILSKIAALQ